MDTDVTPSGSVECEVGGYLVCANRADAWDAIVALLLALDADHPDCFHAVMRGCRRLSNSMPEVDGLDDLLMAPEQLLHDVALEREAPAVAAGIQHAGRRASLSPDGEAAETAAAGWTRRQINPIAAAYFRAADDDRQATRTTLSALDAVPPRARLEPVVATRAIDDPEALDAIVELLAEAGLVPERPRALLEGTPPNRRASRESGR